MEVLVQSVIGGLAFGGIYALAGVTFGLIYDNTKVFHIAFGDIATLGAFVAAVVAGESASPSALVAATLLGMVVAAALTVLVVACVYNPLIRRGADNGVTFVASLGLALLIQAGIILIFGPANRSFSVDALTRLHHIAGVQLSWFIVLSVLLALAVASLTSAVLNRTRAGHQVKAIASNREHSQLVGIRVGVLSVLVCAIGGGLSVIAFVMMGMAGSLVIANGPQLTLYAVLAVLAGGVGSVWGAAGIGFAIGVINGVAGSMVPGAWSTTIVFIIMIALVLGRPGGLVSFSRRATA